MSESSDRFDFLVRAPALILMSSESRSSPTQPKTDLTLQRLFQLRREDPVVLLQNLGFASNEPPSIPERFLLSVPNQKSASARSRKRMMALNSLNVVMEDTQESSLSDR
ncbi:uncharacterized protein LOC134193919 [Corticium candelabrum]|uniref:uncharacterized protein LOC134193919 n=1 Tax=Corticium candelabrum TaxID=121492 RepID=UPI002E264CE5|nr:uncharacterized protein LOC134193919 [Corticium candelabrum]